MCFIPLCEIYMYVCLIFVRKVSPFFSEDVISCLTYATCRQPKPGKWSVFLLTVSSLAFMLPWQFAQFVLLTQQLSLLVIYSLTLVGPTHFLSMTSSLCLALVANIILQFGNTLLLTSFLPPCLVTCLVSEWFFLALYKCIRCQGTNTNYMYVCYLCA